MFVGAVLGLRVTVGLNDGETDSLGRCDGCAEIEGVEESVCDGLGVGCGESVGTTEGRRDWDGLIDAVGNVDGVVEVLGRVDGCADIEGIRDAVGSELGRNESVASEEG